MLGTSTSSSSSTTTTTTAGSQVVFTQLQFQSLLTAVTSSNDTLDSRLNDLRSELLRKQALNADKVAKKARLDRPHSFRSKGNEEQHRLLDKAVVNAQVELEKVVTVLASDPRPSSSNSHPVLADTMEQARKFVEQGQQTLIQCQKLIRMAERSDHGGS